MPHFADTQHTRSFEDVSEGRGGRNQATWRGMSTHLQTAMIAGNSLRLRVAAVGSVDLALALVAIEAVRYGVVRCGKCCVT